MTCSLFGEDRSLLMNKKQGDTRMNETGIDSDLGIPEKVVSALEDTDFDAIITVSIEAFQYLSGYWFPYARHYLTRYNIVIWPRSGQPVLLVGLDQVTGPSQYSWVSDIRSYAEWDTPRPYAMVDALVNIVSDLDLREGRLGIEGLSTSIAFFDRLKTGLPKATFLECDQFLVDLRVVKTPGEVQRLSEIAAISEAGLLLALEAAQPGWTEKELGNEIQHQVLAGGADNVTLVLLGVKEGAMGFLSPTDRKLDNGLLVRVDINAIRRGYYADMGRMAVVGEGSHKQHEVYRKLVDLHGQLVDFMKPGVRAADILITCRRIAERLNLELVEQPSIGLGHSIGVNSNCFPHLNVGEQTILMPGMIFNIEPDVFGPEREVVHLEDMVLIEEQGSKLLTSAHDWSALPSIS